MFCSLSSSCQFFCASFPPYFLTLTCNLSPFCHQSFSSFLHCSSLFLFTNAFSSLISWNPSLIIASLNLFTNASSTILYTYRNNYLRVSDSLLFKGWIVTKQKKPSLSRFLFQVRMVYPSLLWSNLSSMHSVMNTGNHLDSWLNQPFSFYRSRVILTVWWISKHCSSCWRWSRFTILLKKQRKHLHRQTRVKQGPMRMVSVWRNIWCFYRNWQ